MFDGELSTGIPGLDRVLKGLLPGDNVVFQVDAVGDYAAFVPAFCEHAQRRGKRLVYFRFADHAPLVPEDSGAEICRPRGGTGFEQFITDVHQTLEESGRNACFVFDCLTSLAERWYSDSMLANFFTLTCPYIYNLESLAYFAILRGSHSCQASSPIAETAQIFLDVYRHHGELYIRPIKVQRRYSPTMYMLHNWDGDVSWSLFSDRKVPLNKVETDLTNQGIFTLSA